MNEITGTLQTMAREHGVLQADVQITFDTDRLAVMTALVLHAGELAEWRPGDTMRLRFKETEIALAKGLSGLISLRNRYPATVIGIAHGKLLTAVQLQFGQWPLTAVITTGSAERLALNIGDDVEWLVKANEMQLQRIDNGSPT